MNWTRIEPYGPEAYTYWISGIYKCVRYNAGEFHAYFIPDGNKNWGDNVARPPKPGKNGGLVWPSLASAQAACIEHAKAHTPAPATVRRAVEIKAALLALAQEHAA